MTLDQYQEDAFRTCASLGDLRLDLSHMVMGIISEQEEFLKAMVEDDLVNAREEQCDIAWYVSNYCTLRNYKFSEVIGEDYDIFDDELLETWELEVPLFSVYSSKLSDYVKKFIAYGKPIDEKLEKRALKAIIASLFLEETSLNLEVDLQKNIDKLKLRYPDKFNTNDALNRNLKGEREILEK